MDKEEKMNMGKKGIFFFLIGIMIFSVCCVPITSVSANSLNPDHTSQNLEITGGSVGNTQVTSAYFGQQISSNVAAWSVYQALQNHMEKLKTGMEEIPFTFTVDVSQINKEQLSRDLQAGVNAF